MDKYIPKVGEQLYLSQRTGNYWVDMVKTPYTVMRVEKTKVYVQSCILIAPVYHCTGNPALDRPDLEGKRVFFYDTVAERIEPDSNGGIVELTWHSRKGRWGTRGRDEDYPQYAYFGEYMHQPYLN